MILFTIWYILIAYMFYVLIKDSISELERYEKYTKFQNILLVFFWPVTIPIMVLIGVVFYIYNYITWR